MFARFRKTGRRLYVTLIESRRTGASVRQAHVASLGSVSAEPSILERLTFWQRLHERLGQLSNRIDAETHVRVLGQIHARIPMVGIAEQQALQLENAKADERVWSTLAESHREMAEGKAVLSTQAQQSAAENTARAAEAREKATEAKLRIDRLERGEAVEGGLSRPDAMKILRDAGWTDRDFEHAMTLVKVCDLGGFDAYIDETIRQWKVSDLKVARAMLKRLGAH